MRLAALVGWTLLASALGLGPALADKRVALVIGNSTYRHVPALPNPINDAADVGASLERLGFSVRRVANGSYDQMRLALRDFTLAARRSDMAVVYFAGHGMEIGGENWLLPVDAEMQTDLSAEQEAVALRSILPIVGGASNLGLVILDACRNNPFSAKMQRSLPTRAVERGFARVEPAGSVLVAYAAKEGTTANDGQGRNSPFTAALLAHLEKPGLEVGFLFRTVREAVLNSTMPRQEPVVYGSLPSAAIYFKPPAGQATTATPAAPSRAAVELKLPPDLKIEPMQGTFYGRHDGAIVRSGPGSAFAGSRTLKENEAARVLGKVAVTEPNNRQRFWYQLEFPDGGQGFSLEDSVLGEKALEQKQSYKRTIASLDDALQAVQTKSFGRFKGGSGVWKGKGCDSINLPQIRDTRDLAMPGMGSVTQDLVTRTIMSVTMLVYFEDSKVHVASFLRPEKFRVGRLEHDKTLQGIAIYRARMEDGGEGIVVGLKGGQVLLNWGSIFKQNKENVNVLQRSCTGSDANSLVLQAQLHLKRRIEIIWAD